jgi:hypothetical protein
VRVNFLSEIQLVALDSALAGRHFQHHVVGTSRWHVRGLAEPGYLVKLTDIGHLVEAESACRREA